MFKFELNEVVKEKVTGFTGVVMCRSEYNTGCIQYGLLKQSLNKDGNIDEWIFLDETRLEATTKPSAKIKKSIGGPQQTPPTN